MAYIKLDGKCKEFADRSYELEKQVLDLIEDMISLQMSRLVNN